MIGFILGFVIGGFTTFVLYACIVVGARSDRDEVD